MAANAANESELGLLHSAVAKALKDRIGSEDATAADLNAAIKFLKDNNITATPEANRALNELKNELEGAGCLPASDPELEAALDNVLKFPGSIANA